MNNQSYGGIQWIQHHHPQHHTSDELKNDASEVESQLIVGQVVQSLNGTAILDTSNDVSGDDVTAAFLVGDDDAAELDQIAAENLIFMARDGQMVSEFITPDENDAVVVAAAVQDDGTTLVVEGDMFSVDYAEDAPQMITEEIITDDCVEISAEQIIGSNSAQELLEMVQDEYTALRPYPCDFCSRRFRKKASLNNHMIAHQNDRPMLCKLCGARFTRRAELINHFKAHAEEQDAHETEESVKFEQQRSQLDDHYYEHICQIQERYQVNGEAHQADDTEEVRFLANTASENSSSAAVSPTSSASTTTVGTTATRGRISRLKPKEEVSQYVVVNEEKPIATDLDYLECQELQPSTAAVKLSQDQSPAHQPLYPIIDDSKPFVCQECGLAFAREKALSSHVKNHRVESPFECNQCNEMFWDSNSLQEHQKTHQFEESNSEFDPAEAEETQSESESEQVYGEFYCSECGISFHRQDLLRRHTKQHTKLATVEETTTKSKRDALHDGKDLQPCCGTCGETFADALDLLAHAEIHAREPFKCVLCGESFFEEAVIKRHLQSRHSHELTANSCILCGKECRDGKALIKHAWDHSREKCHSCSKCGKNFQNKARLKRHMASHRDKSVICDVCQEEFPDGRSLSNHRHSHSATSSGKLFPCHECGKTFGSRSSQQIHVRIHTGERPYGCRFCWKAFADGGTLRKHERIHTGEKPYACSVCPRAFNQRVVLREHIRSHHSGMDAATGSYICTVCSDELSSSNDLIQHLIQHSDMNTAKQRQPITGPRKYKRRRKLQPHEIAHYRAECKTDSYTTDIDMSDFDMENVDDLLGITAESTTANKSTAKQRKSKKVVNREQKRVAPKRKSTTGSRAARKASTHSNDDEHEMDHTSSSKPRNDSVNSCTSSDKLWDTKYIQSTNNYPEDSYKTLFNNVEHGLQSIESLVVNNNNNNNNKNSSLMSPCSPKTRRSKNVASSQRTQQVQLSPTESSGKAKRTIETTNSKSTSSSASRQRKKLNSKQTKTTTRPRMIHTEKSRVLRQQETSISQKRTRGKTYITRTETSNIDLLQTKSNSSSTTIVDDYEIISPATHPPNQISSSPLHIKQESASLSAHQVQHIYDAQLLLDARSLRNQSIVNDLEEILRSPLKSEKEARQRFTSESSTTPQFLPEDEQIKIEPTSPDLRDMIEGGQRHMPTVVGGARSSCLSSSGALAVNNHCSTANHNNMSVSKGHKSSMMSHKKSTTNNAANNTSPSSTSSAVVAGSAGAKSNNSTSPPSSYLNYSVDSYNGSVNAVSSNSDVSGTFFSISEVVSAADAAAAAAKAAASDKSERKVWRVHFECEMCSAVFYDRGQLLEHVHIHI